MLRVWSALVGVFALLLLASAGHAQTPGPTAINGSLPDGLLERESFEAPLSVTRGTPPITWSIVAGSLPDGVVLHSRTGLLHGTPAMRGEYRFTVQPPLGSPERTHRGRRFLMRPAPAYIRCPGAEFEPARPV